MSKVKVIISNEQNEMRIPTGVRMLIRRCCHAVLVLEEFDGSAEVDVSLVDNARIHEINLEQRNIDAPTDVLSFPLGEDGVYDQNPATGAYMLGDIVISLERARAQAKEFGHSVKREVGYLTIHSMLHLLGYDHLDEGPQKKQMRGREEAIAATIPGMSRN